MKKTSLLLLLFHITFNANSQVIPGGTLDSERKLLESASNTFTILSTATSGVVVVECAVDRDGKVTGTKTIGDKSTVKSTPSILKAENLAKKLTFTPGTKYAQFEQVRVKYTYVVKPKTL